MRNIHNFENFFFNLRVLYFTPNLFVSLIIGLPSLPRVHILFFIFFDFKSDMVRLRNEQTTVTYTYFPEKVPVCGKSGILIQF